MSMSKANDRTVVVPFRAITTGAVAGGSAGVTFSEVNIIPSNLGQRIINTAALYEFWRVKTLRVQQTLSALSNSAQVQYLAFIPIGTAMFTAATTLAEMVDFPHFRMGGVNPTQITIQMSGNALTTFTTNKWLVTDLTGVTDTLFYSAGTITSALRTFASDSTSTTTLLIEGVAEFRAPLDPSLSLFQPRKTSPSPNTVRILKDWEDERKD